MLLQITGTYIVGSDNPNRGLHVLTEGMTYVTISVTDITCLDIGGDTVGKEWERYLPLTESTFYVLLATSEPRHGYGIMQWIADVSEGSVVVGPGTLYGALQILQTQGLIELAFEDERRKFYEVTDTGRSVVKMQVDRFKQMVAVADKHMGGDR